MIARRRRTNSGSEESPSRGNYSQIGNPAADSPPRSRPPIFSNPEMSCRDRTNEFMSAVKSLQSRQGNGVVSQHRNKHLQHRSEFTQIAKQIGKDLSNTFTKLEKLTILAKRKTLYDDKPIEIQELTYIIKSDIGNLNKQIAQLQGVAKGQQSHKKHHLQTHSNSVVVTLQSKLASMSNDFKQVLEVRTENLKHQKSRREHFSQQPVSSSMPPSTLKGYSGSVLLQDEASHANHNGDVSINMDRMDRQKYQQQMQIVDEQDSYIQSRAETMQDIESTIVELGTIFQQLAFMVKEQEEMVQRIDSNVDDTELNIEGAHSEILKYFQSVSSNRWLMIKIFAVLIVFFIIFIVFMA